MPLQANQYPPAALAFFAKYHFELQPDGTVFLPFEYTGYGDPNLNGCGVGHSFPTGNPDDGDGATQWAIYGSGYTANSDSLVPCVPTYYATLGEYFAAAPLDMSHMQYYEAPTNNPSFFEYAAYESVAQAVKGQLGGRYGYFLDPNLIGYVESHPSSAWVDFREGLLKQFIIPALTAAIGGELSAESGAGSAAGASTTTTEAGSTAADFGVDAAGATVPDAGGAIDLGTGAATDLGNTGISTLEPAAGDLPAAPGPSLSDLAGGAQKVIGAIGTVRSAITLLNPPTPPQRPAPAPAPRAQPIAKPASSSSGIALIATLAGLALTFL